MFVVLEVLACSLADSGEELQRAIILTRSWGLATAGSEDEITYQRAVPWRGSLGTWEEVG